MERVELGTPDLTKENIDKVCEMFPQVITEVMDDNGEIKRAVDFDVLRDLLGDVAEGTRERYQFTWPGKREAKAEARRPIAKTMCPCPEESVNWDTTENLYIEGDNLDALKILKETYAGKVKMIYIDPPYNTGHDFVYDDDFAKTRGEYEAESGDFDLGGGRLVANPESNGRFHSDWCSMMYPRLLLARDLLSADGVIFISIDDNEIENLLKIASECFGRDNCEMLIWNKEAEGSSGTLKAISTTRRVHEYILCAFKDKSCVEFIKIREPLKGKENDFQTANLAVNSKNERVDHPNYFTLVNPSGDEFTRQWKWDRQTINNLIKENLIYWGSDGHKQPRLIIPTDDRRTTYLLSILNYGGTTVGRKDFDRIMGAEVEFSYPKPVLLIKKLILTSCPKGQTVMDFFSGSSTTAESVMCVNLEESRDLNYVLVQLPEICARNSEAVKAGYANICEIGKERIRRAGAKIKAEVEEANKQLKLGEEPKKVPDIGFRVLKIDSSNFNNTLATPSETSQESLLNLIDNVKDGRSDIDILFEVLPKFRIPYSVKIEEQTIGGKRCFNVEDGLLIACFDSEVSTSTIEEIAKMQPIYAVMRDTSMADDATHANFEELFRIYSPDTIRRVI